MREESLLFFCTFHRDPSVEEPEETPEHFFYDGIVRCRRKKKGKDDDDDAEKAEIEEPDCPEVNGDEGFHSEPFQGFGEKNFSGRFQSVGVGHAGHEIDCTPLWMRVRVVEVLPLGQKMPEMAIEFE